MNKEEPQQNFGGGGQLGLGVEGLLAGRVS